VRTLGDDPLVLEVGSLEFGQNTDFHGVNRVRHP
jgi:hypothetical protein